MKIIAAIMAVIKAIPIIDKWMEKLFIAYSLWKKEQVAEQTKIEIDQAVKTQDQRRVEGESHSGNYSGVGDIRASLPGVMRDKKPD